MLSASILKSTYLPEVYYKRTLLGSFSKYTGNGWYTWGGLCPFHNDRHTGSLVINKRTGAFKCFSCGASGGDIIDFHMQYNRIGFKEAIEQLWRTI